MPGIVPTPQNGSISCDLDGFAVTIRTPITSVGTSIGAGTANQAITSTPAAANVPFIQRIGAVCQVAPTADVVATILDSSGGTTLLNIDLLSSYTEGQAITFDFPTPIRGLAAEPIRVTTPATGGTWRWYVNGYLMNSNVIPT